MYSKLINMIITDTEEINQNERTSEIITDTKYHTEEYINKESKEFSSEIFENSSIGITDSSKLSDTNIKTAETAIDYSSQFASESGSNIEKQADISSDIETSEFTDNSELTDTKINTPENIIKYSSQFISDSSSNIKEHIDISSNIQTIELSTSSKLSDSNFVSESSSNIIKQPSNIITTELLKSYELNDSNIKSSEVIMDYSTINDSIENSSFNPKIETSQLMTNTNEFNTYTYLQSTSNINYNNDNPQLQSDKENVYSSEILSDNSDTTKENLPIYSLYNPFIFNKFKNIYSFYILFQF